MPRWPKRNQRQGVDEYGRTAVWSAASGGDAALLRKLISKGEDPNLGDDVGFTPLHVAVQNGHIHVIEALIELGANVNAVDKHGNGPLWTSLLSAPKELRQQIAQRLTKAGANADYVNLHGRTPREMASMRGYVLEAPAN